MKNQRTVLWAVMILILTLTACQPAVTSGTVSGKICFPSDTVPALTLYFQSIDDQQAISYQAHEGQTSYSLELEPGTYHAYSWLPTGMLVGGMYSAAVPCGLKASCSDHSLLPVVVQPGQETGGVDICDWYADPGTAPLPPGRVEGLIAAYWQGQFEEQIAAELISTEEITTMQGELAKQLGGRLFRVLEGPIKNETFLISYNSQVIRLGRTAGGRGVTSLALADLDQDERAELYFTYSIKHEEYQTQLAVYAPEHDLLKTFEALTYYQGDLMLFSEQPHQVGVRVVEGDPETKTIRYQDTLGYLKLQVFTGDPKLEIDLLEELAQDVQEKLILDPAWNPGELWKVVEDPHYGVRFAVPCFWEVPFPEQYHNSGASYPVRNYNDAFEESFGKESSQVWENGGVKITFDYLSGRGFGLTGSPSLEEFLTALMNNPDQELLAAEPLTVNGQDALRVEIADTRFNNLNRVYIFQVDDNLFLIFSASPGSDDLPDVLGILNSLAISPEVDVKVPSLVPEESPLDVVPACLQ